MLAMKRMTQKLPFYSLSLSVICCFTAGADNVHLKILVPSIAAGAIIGKGGETIAQVQKDAGARVKMSKANDFYPGMFCVCSVSFDVLS